MTQAGTEEYDKIYEFEGNLEMEKGAQTEIWIRGHPMNKN